MTDHFERDYGCTPADWLRWLPGAVAAQHLSLAGPSATVAFSSGHLLLRWAELPPRKIVLLHMPRLQVWFAFEGVTEAQRQHFMRYFDLYMQRGGG